MQRTHLAPGWRSLRPPYHGLWKLKARADIEFPPSVAYGKVYVAQQKGRFFAVNARTGKVVWTRHFTRCAAASPTIADGIVYQAYMHELPCRKHAGGARGFVIAWNARNGKEYWRVRAGSVESSPVGRRQEPLLRLLGPESLRVPAARQAQAAAPLDVQGGRPDRGGAGLRGRHVCTSRRATAASTASTPRPGASAGTRPRSRASGGASTSTRRRRSPTGASSSGTRTAPSTPSAPTTGHLLWARDVGTYVYTAAAVWRKTVFVGTWDGNVHRARRAHRRAALALRRAVGDHRRADGARRPRLLLDLREVRRRRAPPRQDRPPRNLRAERAERRCSIWRFHDGKYSARRRGRLSASTSRAATRSTRSFRSFASSSSGRRRRGRSAGS